MHCCDVAIIGGGPAGSSAAIYLRQKGYSVTVFEKEKFPREHVGESLIPFCYYHLRDMGVLEKVKTFATYKPGIQFTDKDGLRQSVWCFERILNDGAEMVFHTLRAPFDKALLDHARELGADVLEEHLVQAVELNDFSQVSLNVSQSSGEKHTYRAKFLLDASGQSAFLARKLHDKQAYPGLRRTAFYRRWKNNRYDRALNAGLIKLVYLGDDKQGWFWAIPIGRNYLSVGVSLDNDYVRERKKDFQGESWKNEFYMRELREASCLSEILADSIPEQDANAVSDYSYYARNKFGSNWAMIGDSGAFLDPIFSSGLFVAMESAKRVSNAIDHKFGNGVDKFPETFLEIEGAYQLIEKFVRLFYDPDLLKFSHLGSSDDGFARFTHAYNIFHYLMAGDFFANHKKYHEFIDTLLKERKSNQFIIYARNKVQEFPDEDYCRHTFEEVFGHLPQE